MEVSSEARHAVSRPTNPARWLDWLDWISVGLVAMAAAALHIRFATEVGGLWRDETNSVNLATLPTLAEVWHFLDYDSFPILYFAVLRAWTSVVGVGNDEALRGLGLLIGLGILGVLWSNARAFGCRLPVLSLALVGLNPMIVRYGDSNRAYGLGILLILLTLRSFWRLVEQPSRPSASRIAVAAVLAVLSVQCLYYNSVLLLAIAFGASVVAVRAKAWRTVSIIIGIGAMAAASLLPYVPIIIRMRAWTFLVSYPTTLSWLWKRACEVMGSPRPGAIWLWVGLVAASLGVAIVAAPLMSFRRRRLFTAARSLSASDRLPAVVLFALVNLVVGVAGYAVFLRALNYYTRPWYYITLAVFVACTLDAIFGAWTITAHRQAARLVLRSLRPLVALTFLCLTLPLSWREMPTRQTNVDLIAARIEELSRKGDVIVLPRWECAITFCRYYHGPAEIVTIPPMDDHRFHRYDLVVAQMRKANAHEPVLARVAEALHSGHRVFLADSLPFPTTEVQLPDPYPLYQDPNGGWHGAPYDQIWQARVGGFLRVHATSARALAVSLPVGIKVQELEDLQPAVVEGWR